MHWVLHQHTVHVYDGYSAAQGSHVTCVHRMRTGSRTCLVGKWQQLRQALKKGLSFLAIAATQPCSRSAKALQAAWEHMHAVKASTMWYDLSN